MAFNGKVTDSADSGEIVKAQIWFKDGFMFTKTPMREDGDETDIGDGKAVYCKYTARGTIDGMDVWLNGNFGTISLIGRAQKDRKAAAKGKAKGKGVPKPTADDETPPE
jgi:hypothetical protein